MGEKTIAEYTAQNAPATTSKLIIDEGDGDYKSVTIAKMNTNPIITGYLYLGEPLTDGSLRLYSSNNSLVCESRIAGEWVFNGAFIPPSGE